jgi:hypothetical protein
VNLSSLPDRPLELSELRELDGSGEFRTVLPAAVFDLDESDHKLVPVVVLVTADRIAAVGFDVEDGWTQVDSDEADDDAEELQRRAEDANRTLQGWAQKTQQPWAEPGNGSVLLEYFH